MGYLSLDSIVQQDIEQKCGSLLSEVSLTVRAGVRRVNNCEA
jgi:hypothetical protein